MQLVYEIQNYIDLVRSGKRRACKEQFQLIRLVEFAFENEDIYVDEELLDGYKKLEKYYPYKLFPWEWYVFTCHNCVFRADGFLRWPELHLFVGRGTGKNGYNSFEQYANSSPTNGVRNYDIVTVAAAEDNAKQSFDELYDMLESNPKFFSKYFEWNKECITNIATNSKIYYSTSSPKSKDGGRQGEIILDEYHSYENFELVNVLEGGLGKKEKARIIKSSSFGDVRDGPFDNDLNNDIAILNGEIEDGGVFPFICRLDDESEIDDFENMEKSCPSINYLPTVKEEYKRQWLKYKRNPYANLSFPTKRCGIPKGKNVNPVTTLENIKATNKPFPELKGRKCIVGIDYARLNDFVSAGFLFNVDGQAVWYCHSWVCINGVDFPRIKAPLKEWEARGDLTLVDAVEIDADIPTQWIDEKRKELELTPICACLDDYRLPLMKKALSNIGFDTDKNGKNNIKLVRPSDIIKIVPVLDSYFDNEKIIFGDTPIMRWYVGNTAKAKAKNNGEKYVKQEAKSRKTDGFSAFYHAFTKFDELNSKEGSLELLEMLEMIKL